ADDDLPGTPLSTGLSLRSGWSIELLQRHDITTHGHPGAVLQWGRCTMLFCLTADYTPQALNAMRENPETNRREAVIQLLEAAGGSLIEMYGTSANGPGALVIFDVPDPQMAPAMCGVAMSAGAIQNVKLTRLFAMDEIT